MRTRPAILPILLLVSPMLLSGCIRRTLSISSTPPGALVWLNDREVGRTPLNVDFRHYGTYDVRIERDGHEPIMTSRKASAPLWDLPGPDFVVEILPLDVHSQIAWHFDLEPRDESHPALLERARAFRTEANAAESGSPPGTDDLTVEHLDETQPPKVAPEPAPEGDSKTDRDSTSG